jgi:two-component system, cell cycle sensor histidine kinase and response regulator CckA
MDSPQKRIWIVDDEPALLKMMGVYLTRKGFAVTTLDTTDRAWAAVNEAAAEFDAVVIDGSMRGLSAEDLGLRILKANPAACVLMASGYPVDMSRLEAAAPGRVGFVQKPFTPQALAEAVRRMLAPEKEDV